MPDPLTPETARELRRDLVAAQTAFLEADLTFIEATSLITAARIKQRDARDMIKAVLARLDGVNPEAPRPFPSLARPRLVLTGAPLSPTDASDGDAA